MAKMKCILVDDDPLLLQMIQDLCQNSPIAEITRSYLNPKEFIDALPELDFDLCLLDIYMPELEGIVVAQMLENKPIIFVTGTDNKFKDALDLSPIDIVTKPIKKERLDKALAKAYSLINENKEFALFNVAEKQGKMKLKLADMVLVEPEEADPRNKKVTMKDGSRHTLMNYRLEDLLEINANFIQVSKSEIISADAIENLKGKMITLRLTTSSTKPINVKLSSAFRRKFLQRLHFTK